VYAEEIAPLTPTSPQFSQSVQAIRDIEIKYIDSCSKN
jgi:hypothetical protein